MRKFISSHYVVLFYRKTCGGKYRGTFNTWSRFGKDEKTDTGGSANYADREDVWTIPREYKTGEIRYQNQLPIALVDKILAYSEVPGGLVLDPFVGGGTIPLVALRRGMSAIGVDRNIYACRYSVRRMKSEFKNVSSLIKCVRVA